MNRATTMVVVVESRDESAAAVAAVAERAEREGARLDIVAVPFRVPLSAGGGGFGLSQPWSVMSLRAAAQAEAEAFSRYAAGLVPPGVPTGHRVALASLRGELERILGDALVSYLFVDRRLLRRQLRARRMLGRARERGVEVAVVEPDGVVRGGQNSAADELDLHEIGPRGAIGG